MQSKTPATEIPKKYTCAVTYMIMKDPVKLNTCDVIVDRATILKLKNGCKPNQPLLCPFTKELLIEDICEPQIELKKEIDQFLKKNPEIMQEEKEIIAKSAKGLNHFPEEETLHSLDINENNIFYPFNDQFFQNRNNTFNNNNNLSFNVTQQLRIMGHTSISRFNTAEIPFPQFFLNHIQNFISLDQFNLLIKKHASNTPDRLSLYKKINPILSSMGQTLSINEEQSKNLLIAYPYVKAGYVTINNLKEIKDLITTDEPLLMLRSQGITGRLLEGYKELVEFLKEKDMQNQMNHSFRYLL